MKINGEWPRPLPIVLKPSPTCSPFRRHGPSNRVHRIGVAADQERFVCRAAITNSISSTPVRATVLWSRTWIPGGSSRLPPRYPCEGVLSRALGWSIGRPLPPVDDRRGLRPGVSPEDPGRPSLSLRDAPRGGDRPGVPHRARLDGYGHQNAAGLVQSPASGGSGGQTPCSDCQGAVSRFGRQRGNSVQTIRRDWARWRRCSPMRLARSWPGCSCPG